MYTYVPYTHIHMHTHTFLLHLPPVSTKEPLAQNSTEKGNGAGEKQVRVLMLLRRIRRNRWERRSHPRVYTFSTHYQMNSSTSRTARPPPLRLPLSPSPSVALPPSLSPLPPAPNLRMCMYALVLQLSHPLPAPLFCIVLSSCLHYLAMRVSVCGGGGGALGPCDATY